ncbi:MAG: DNA-binding response OmpR family regulator [Planctomycetota bacterium]|jgi:DNA-binding response OmpR family regulator
MVLLLALTRMTVLSWLSVGKIKRRRIKSAMPSTRVLVVEDDEAIRQGLVDALTFAGYDVCQASDGEAGLLAATSGDIDLVLLDVLMPKRDGFSVLSELRARRGSLPVIMLTARGEEADRIRGLRDGADDYVVKPFSADELLARVDAVLRRSPERKENVKLVTIAQRVIDFNLRCINFEDGTSVALSERECSLLAYLARNQGRCLPRDEILSAVWGLDPRGIKTRTVDMHIARIRERLRDTAGEIIKTIRSRGYIIDVEVVDS